jgi:hypothetical protein
VPDSGLKEYFDGHAVLHRVGAVAYARDAAGNKPDLSAS